LDRDLLLMTGPGTPAASAYRGAIATRFATRAAIVSSSHPSNIHRYGLELAGCSARLAVGSTIVSSCYRLAWSPLGWPWRQVQYSFCSSVGRFL